MSQRWNLNFIKGRTYQTTLTITGVADIATATSWRLDAAFPNEAPFLQASTSNGLFVAGNAANQKILVIPSGTTALWAMGNGRFDFWIEWAGGVKRPYYTNGSMSVTSPVGEVSP